MRRTFLLASALVAALSVAWTAAPVVAAPPGVAALTASAQRSLTQSLAPTHTHTLSAPAPAVGSLPAQLTAFAGIGEQASILAAGSGNAASTTPADPSIAAGATAIVEAVNSAVFVYSRSNPSAAPHQFNLNALVRTSPGWAVRSPHVIYDPFSGRFILAVLQYNASRSGCSNDGSQIQVAVSNADPTAAWQTARTFNNVALFSGSDIPVAVNVSLGVTSTVVDISWDYTDCLNTAPVKSQTDIVQRSDLTAGTLGVNSAVAFTGGPAGVQPAMALGLAGVEYQIANDASCAGPATNTFAVFSITGTPEARNVTAPACSGLGFAETHGSSAPPDASQKGTAATLQTNDDRFLDVVWAANTLWATGNTGCTPGGDTSVRSCVNVVSATASTTGSVSGGTQLAPEGVSGAYLYYPSLAVDNGSPSNVFITFNESSSSTFVSMMLASITGGSTWSSSFTTLHTSTTFYSPGGCSVCTWGDFSTAVQDPSHPSDVWVVAEDTDANTGTGCATLNTCWNTYIGRFSFAGPTVALLTPASGPATGGQMVTVAGSDFAPDSTLTFNGAPTAITLGSITPDSFTFTTPSTTTSGVVQTQVTDSRGTSPTGVGSAYIYVGLANYVPLSPFRILDTRPGLSCVQCTVDHAFGPGMTQKVQLTGVTGLKIGADPIPTTATAVVLNVTEVSGTAASLLTAYPFGTRPPTASNLNFQPRTVIPNLVTVTLGQGGAINIFNAAGTVNVLADVEGYFAPQPATDVTGEFHPIAPTRVCDTRSSGVAGSICRLHGALTAGNPIVVNVTGTGGISPTVAAAAVLNLTGVAGNASTYLSVFPTSSNGTCAFSGSHAPSFSTLNLGAGAVEANRVMVTLGPAVTGGADTSICIYNAVGTINVLVDANGWFGGATAPAGSQYQAIQPTRICDTRAGSGTQCAGHTLGSLGIDLVAVAGQAGMPVNGSSRPVLAVIVNLTAIAPSQTSYLVLYPAVVGARHPAASDVNVGAGQVLPNLVAVQVDATGDANNGDVYLFNAAGVDNAIIDVEGWFQ